MESKFSAESMQFLKQNLAFYQRSILPAIGTRGGFGLF